MSIFDRALKYAFDRIASLSALLLLWPFLLVVAAVIYAVMPDGSPIFVQQRVGKDGKLFRILKFRTMFCSLERREVEKVPPFVRFVRRYKIDELPQLLNVLVARMSFVGPRPDVPGYADRLEGEDREILRLRPGITGPASLKYRNEEQLLSSVDDPVRYNDEFIYPDKVRINLHYLHNYSFITDIRIILITLFGGKMEYDGDIIG